MNRIIRVVDFETNGTEPPAEVIEVGWCDVLEGAEGWSVGAPIAYLCAAERLTCETRAIHHIRPVDIADREPFHARSYLEQSVRVGVVAIAAHHADFEAKWLGPLLDGLPMMCSYKAELRVWPEAPEHKNQVLRYWLEEQGLTNPDPELAQPAHRAGPDAYATAHLLAALLKNHTPEQLIAWTKEPAALPRMPIGKQRGARWHEVEQGFLESMLRQATMDPDLKWNANRELERRRADGLNR